MPERPDKEDPAPCRFRLWLKAVQVDAVRDHHCMRRTEQCGVFIRHHHHAAKALYNPLLETSPSEEVPPRAKTAVRAAHLVIQIERDVMLDKYVAAVRRHVCVFHLPKGNFVLSGD